jgi:hypothetical protein
MTGIEVEKVFSIFIELLETIQTSVFQVDGITSERFVLRKTFPTHYAMCSWPHGSVTGFLPYSLALEKRALGCRHSIGTTSTDLILCIAAPNVEALQEALGCVQETNVLFLGAETDEPPQLSIWVRGPNSRNHEIPNYQGEDLGQIDFDKVLESDLEKEAAALEIPRKKGRRKKRDKPR